MDPLHGAKRLSEKPLLSKLIEDGFVFLVAGKELHRLLRVVIVDSCRYEILSDRSFHLVGVSEVVWRSYAAISVFL